MAMANLSERPRRRRLAWHLSALFYRWTYLRIAHQVDDDLVAYLGVQLKGARVADCGCGPGIVAHKLLMHGAGHVMALDANSAMLRQARTLLEDFAQAGMVEVREEVIDSRRLALLSAEMPGKFDVVLFKRSLYAPAPEVAAIVGAAMDLLGPCGVLAVVHPETQLRAYAFGPGFRWRRHTAFHLVNRLLSRAAVLLGISEYRPFRRQELTELLNAPGRDIEAIPSNQSAYNMVAVRASTASTSSS